MLKIWYFNNCDNAGDYFNEFLLQKLNIDYTFESESPDLIACGSILGIKNVDEHTIAWGSGLISEKSEVILKLENIKAVRGKLTAEILGLKNVVFGDPGIFASKFYKPNSKKKWKFGIIPHFIDFDFFNKLQNKNVKIIDIRTKNLENLFEEINSCEFILSSSLHGIIFAHSFGIPSYHLIHNKTVPTINDFKFKDYYSNFNLPYVPKQIKKLEDLNFNHYSLFSENKDQFCPTKEEIETMQNNLMSCFPFKDQQKI